MTRGLTALAIAALLSFAGEQRAWTELGSAQPGVPAGVRPPGVERSPSRGGMGSL